MAKFLAIHPLPASTSIADATPAGRWAKAPMPTEGVYPMVVVDSEDFR